MMTRGWCPSVHEPMPTGDGLLVRIKPRGGLLTASEMRLITRFGNGAIELTSRGNLQLRGLAPHEIEPCARAMVAAGLASPDPAAERRRNVIATPLAGLDPAVSPATAAIAAALETALEADATLALPAKFSFVVDGGGLLSLAAIPARIRLTIHSDHAVVDTIRVALHDAVGTALARAHLPATVAEPSSGAVELTPPIGRIGAIAFGAALPFGVALAPLWIALADLAERYGGVLRLTPWRTVLIAGLPDPQTLADLGLIIDPDDPRLRVAACPGQPGCASATVPTRPIAARLCPPPGITVHVSGCAKGCAHPGPATVTLVGQDGCFGVVRHGRAGDPAQALPP